MNKDELRKTVTEAAEQWLKSLDNEEYADMDEFTLSFQIIRCACGRTHDLSITRRYGGEVECADDDYEDPETRGEPR